MSTTTSRPAAPGPGVGGQPPVAPIAPPKVLSARRRRPGLIGLSIALIAVGGLTGAVTMAGSGHRTSVLALAQPVPVGTQITAQDLTTASITLDPALTPVPASDSSKIIGKYASVDLKPGTLVTMGDVTGQQLVGPDQQVVGVLLKPGQLPATPLSLGQSVLVVATPAQDADLPTSIPLTLPGTIVRVGAVDTDGNTTVDLAVSTTNGPALAAWAATGRVAVIVQSRDSAG